MAGALPGSALRPLTSHLHISPPGLEPPQPPVQTCPCGAPLEREQERDHGMCLDCYSKNITCGQAVLSHFENLYCY
jgi:hypothetical protein